MLKKNYTSIINKSKSITIIDSTLRDGSHAVKHRFSKSQISKYAQFAENANVEVLIVGHGNGLGGSSLHLGLSKLTDPEMLIAAKKNLSKTKIGAFIIPGFGTIQNDLNPAIKAGIKVLMVASHCTEANITRQYIEYAVENRLKVYGVLMMSHMISGKELLVQARLMEEYGASGVLLMDSAGAYLMSDVYEKVGTLSSSLKITVGFHAHNNLGLAVANSITAVEAGASIIDATSCGLGAGAGNCPLEVIVADLQKMGIRVKPNLYKLMDAADYVRKSIMIKPQEINSVTLTSGLAGIFSGFAPHVEKAAGSYNVDIRDLLLELGKEGVVAGQEDIIIHLAERLSRRKIV
jgi:4-hydroxy 2-oxovalerate aldolase